MTDSNKILPKSLVPNIPVEIQILLVKIRAFIGKLCARLLLVLPTFYNLEVIRFFFDWKLLPMSKFIVVFDKPVDADVASELDKFHCIPVMNGKVWLLPSSILPTDFLNLLSEDVENFYICPAYEASFSDLADKRVYDNWLNDSSFHRNMEVKLMLENKHSNICS